MGERGVTQEVPSFVMKPRFPALQPACNLGPLPTPTSAAASPPSRPPQETPRAPLGTRAGAAVSPRSLGWGWQRLHREAVEPWIPTKQGSWQRPPRRGPPEYRPWGRGRCWRQGQKAKAEDGPHGTGRTRTAPASKGKRGTFDPSKEEPTPARLPKVPLALGAHEAQARPGGP